MTICLGVPCDDGTKAVVAADRMLSGADVEFEQDVHKIDVITESCVILSAGSALPLVDLVRNVKNSLQGKRNPVVLDVVTELKRAFVEERNQRAEEEHLRPLGMSLEGFRELQGRLPEPLVLRLTRNIESAELDLELLVVGVDNSGAHLYHMYDPGVADCFDAIGFCAIGSGERHADLTFIRSGYSPKLSLNRAVFLAYQAKRDSEVAPGVGSRFTDLGIIDDTGFHFLHQDVLDSLRGAYEELMGFHSSGHGQVQAQIDAIQLKYSPQVTKKGIRNNDLKSQAAQKRTPGARPPGY